ncbi:hypothetical protein F5Y01DRAFT_305693 [Xylaria sp. FL0043]|nr:hypothetical protein F5Y01DRAFT_305693 [Xylaria sp. FL0043]
MSGRALLQRPSWLPRSSDNSYYVGANTLTDIFWEIFFDILSKYPHLDFGSFEVDEWDTQFYIRGKLACLLPDSDYQYSHDQVSVWTSLMTSPLTVSNEDLQKVIAMEDWQSFLGSECGAPPNPRGFFLCQWTLSVSEFSILAEYFKKQGRTVYELVAWDEFIKDKKLKATDQIFLRYIGSCAISEWPVKPMANLYGETEDVRSGILADFLKALLAVLPTVATTRQCHLLRDITTSAEDEKGCHELVHSILIEFFGGRFVLNRQPDRDWCQWLTERNAEWARLVLRFDHSTLQEGFQCSSTVAAKLQDLFKRIMEHVARSTEAAVNSASLQFDEAKCAALLGQSMPKYYKGTKPIMTIAARSMHINDYIHGRPFSYSHDPGNQLVGQLLSHFKHLDLRAMHAEPFSYYCLAPWPKYGSLQQATVTFGKEMSAMLKDYSEYDPPHHHTADFLEEAGEPQFIMTNDDNKNTHCFIHVPLLDPSQCRYGNQSVDEVARNFMHTSFLNAMLIADKVMDVLDNPKAIEKKISHCTSYEQVVVETALDLYYHTLENTEVGRTLKAKFNEDLKMLKELVKKEPLFLP